MKRIVLTIILLASNSVSAFATDLLVKTLPVAVPTYNWSGFYAGLSVGFSGVSKPSVRYDQLYNSPRVPISQSGLLIGGQAGINWQSGITVFGVETDIQYRNASDGSQFLFPADLGVVGQPFGSGEDDTTRFNSAK